ncbi:MAG TPA: M28 family peptidase [Acidobacteriota bacterium]|nr:M28 family peptidase [Acidobacteriota bacterium]
MGFVHRRGRAGVFDMLIVTLATLVAVAVAPAPQAVEFDGERALAHAAAMVALGPRPLNSDALEKNRAYIEEELEALGLEPWRDEFTADTPLGPSAMANILVEVPAREGSPDSPIILLSGHYDTKRFDGVEFVGANDGASSAAMLLTLAPALLADPIGLPVWLVFFDGEEAVVEWTADDSTYGSRHLVERFAGDGTLERIGAMILFDMIGDKDLGISREMASTAWLTDIVWSSARELGHEANFPNTYHQILDDHLPFLEAGVDAIDLIDFNYGPGNRYWHSPFDTFDKLGASSFQIVGDVTLASLPRIEAALRP